MPNAGVLQRLDVNRAQLVPLATHIVLITDLIRSCRGIALPRDDIEYSR